MNRITEGQPGPSSGFSSPRRRSISSISRNPSVSSDWPSTSTISLGLTTPPMSVSPEAAFIAASAASQIVTNDHDSHADTWYDQQGLEPSAVPPTVSPPALRLVNNFLDQLLFNVLQLSRSTTLATLRPAVTEVLKPKLAKDAINQADEELREYLGGSEDDEFGLPPLGEAARRSWDFELAWKRTRLRCMVYSSLGDMEEEDEDFYTEQGNLKAEGDDDDVGDDTVVSPAVAIFLTSILEFMGEQALIVAGQAAYHRLRTRHEKELRDGAKNPGDVADAIVVEELDMERVALDRTLGRLWRAWKKRVRGPADSINNRSFSRDSPLRRLPSNGHDSSSARARQQPTPDADGESVVSVRLADEEPQATTASAQSFPRPVSDSVVSAPQSTTTDASTGTVAPATSSSSSDENHENHERHESHVARRSFAPPEPEEDRSRPRKKAARPRSLLLFPRVPTEVPASSPMWPVTAHGGRPPRRSNSVPPISPEGHLTAPSVGTTEAGRTEPRTEPWSEPWSELPKRPSKRRSSHRYSARSMMINDENSSTMSEADAGEDDMDATPKPAPPRSTRRLTKLITSVSMVSSAIANATAAAATPPTTAPPFVPAPARYPGTAEEVGNEVVDFTEEPQILTTERVSLRDRSASPSTSDSGRQAAAPSVHRSSSVHSHSARIVEVTPRPRTPALSRAPSLEPMERVRPMSIHISRSTPASPFPDEYRTPSEGVRPSTGRSPAWPPSQPIAEVEEEAPIVGRDDKEVAPTTRPVAVEPVRGPGTQSTSKKKVDAAGPTAFEVRPRSPQKEDLRKPSEQPQQRQPQRQQQKQQQQHQRSATVSRPKAPPAISDSQQRQQQQEQQQQPPPPPPPPPIPTPTRSAERTPRALRHEPAPRQEKAHVLLRSVPGPDEGPQRAESPISANFSATSTSGRPKAGSARPADDGSSARSAALDFEELIHSDETLQYTLTPENMRDDDATAPSLRGESSIISLRRRPSEDARLTRARSRSNPTAPGDARPSFSLKRGGSVSRATGLNSHPVLTVETPRLPAKRPGQAREARTPNDSIANMARFLRSTGPDGPVVERPPPGTAASLRNHGHSVSAGSPRSYSPAQTSSPRTPGGNPSGRTSAASSRLKLQARDAVVEKREDNSDLIDFIRRGPPGPGGNNRIPRTMAHFRTTTADSDQMPGAVGAKAADAAPPDVRASLATQNTTMTDTSMQSSINSHTLLIKKSPSVSTPKTFDNINENAAFYDDIDDTHMDGMPKRKQRRMPADAYIADSDKDNLGTDNDNENDDDEAGEEDDELEDLYHTAVRPRRPPAAKEESLAEFLASCEPPPSPPPQAKPKRRPSAAGLMGRLTRGRSISNHSKDDPAKPRTPYETRSLSSRTGPAAGPRGHIPLQASMPSSYEDAYGPFVSPITAATADHKRPATSATASPARTAPQSAGRITARRFEAREPSSTHVGRTNDLAVLLRDSEPPEMPAPFNNIQQQQQQSDSPSGFARMFSRRKKSLAA